MTNHTTATLRGRAVIVLGAGKEHGCIGVHPDGYYCTAFRYVEPRADWEEGVFFQPREAFKDWAGETSQVEVES